MPKSNPNNGGFIQAYTQRGQRDMLCMPRRGRDDFKLISVKGTCRNLIPKSVSVIIEFFITLALSEVDMG